MIELGIVIAMFLSWQFVFGETGWVLRALALVAVLWLLGGLVIPSLVG